ncbi:MAG: RNA-binding protein [Bacteroidales bacterium]|jgi:RNA recognition motif-containing protein|nr:RNA-binding protein [Bacteroidales bacterium]
MNIYISNLSFKVEDNDLQELFAEYGTVSSAKVITDKFTNRSRGFGFVEMPEKSEAIKAINELNQAEYDGKVISVSEARPREEKPKNFNRGGYNNNNNNRNNYRRD